MDVRNSTQINLQNKCSNLNLWHRTEPIQIRLSRIYKIQIHHKHENPPDLNLNQCSCLGHHFTTKKTAKLRNFIWLEIDSCLQTNELKPLNSSCDSTRPSLESTLARLEKILDDFDSKGLWLWVDSGSTEIVNLLHHVLCLLFHLSFSNCAHDF